MAAVGRSDWKSAVAAFREAQQEVPFEPAVLFRLALTHDKAAHELQAAAWYRAYLAATPQAANVQEVRQRVGVLETAVRSKARELVGVAAKTLPIVLESLPPGDADKKQLDSDLRSVVYLQALAGDAAGAAKTLDLARSDAARSDARSNLIAGLVRAGDCAGAADAIQRWAAAERRGEALSTAIGERAALGDAAGARLLAARLEGTARDRAYCRIAETLADLGLSREAQQTAALVPPTLREHDPLYGLGWSLAMIGELDAALSLVERIEPAAERTDALANVAKMLAAYRGDVPNACRVAARITASPADTARAGRWILWACAKTGDAAGVRQSAARVKAELSAITDAHAVAHSHYMIGLGLAAIGDYDAAEKEVPGIDDYRKAEVAMLMVARLLAAGNAERAGRAAELIPKADAAAKDRRLAQALLAAGRKPAPASGPAVDPAVLDAFNGDPPTRLHNVVAALVQTGNAAAAEAFVAGSRTTIVNQDLVPVDKPEPPKPAEASPHALVRAYLQATIAAGLHRRGETKPARTALAKAWDYAAEANFAESLSIGPEESTVYVYEAVATELADAGDIVGLRETVRQIPPARAQKMKAGSWDAIARLHARRATRTGPAKRSSGAKSAPA